MLRTCRGARVTLSSTVRWGKRLNCWNTMPVSRRTSWMLRTSSDSSIPSTTIRPRSCFSSRLMHRMRVDLPPPEGPMTTTFSPRPTAMSMSLRAWKSPKNLSTPSSSMIVSPVALVASVNTDCSVIARQLPISSPIASPRATWCTNRPRTPDRRRRGSPRKGPAPGTPAVS